MQCIKASQLFTFVLMIGLAEGVFSPVIFAADCPELEGRWPYGESWAVENSGPYLYFSSGTVLMVADVSDPGSPAVIGELNLPGAIRAITIVGDTAFVAAGEGGLRIIDISTPASPVELGSLALPYRAWKVEVEGDLAFVLCVDYYASETSSLHVVDVSNPAQPMQLGFIGTETRSRDLAVKGNHVYVGGSGIWNIDISDPSNPVLSGGFAGFRVNALELDGDILHVGSNQWVDAGHHWVEEFRYRVYDVTNPATPSYLGKSYFIEPFYLATLKIAGQHAYLTGPRYDILVFDVSNLSNIVLLERYFTPDDAADMAISAGIAYVSANRSGVRILDLSSPSTPLEITHIPVKSRPTLTTFAGTVAVTASQRKWRDSETGLRIFDVTQQANPTEIGWCETPGFLSWIEAAGLYVYATGWTGSSADRNGAFWACDISTPSSPVLVSTVDTPGEAVRFVVSGEYVYVADGSGGLRVLSLVDPAHPVEVGFLDRTGDNFLDVAVHNKRAYVINSGLNGVEVINIAFPPTPSPLMTYSSSSWFTDVAVASHFMYLAYRDGDNYELWIVDISYDPVLTNIVDGFSNPITALTISGQDLFAAVFEEGLWVFDISDPANPVTRTVYSAPGLESYGIAVDGSRVYLGSTTVGFEVLDYGSCDFTPLFSDDFESGTTNSWSYTVLNHADEFNAFLTGREIGGEYVQCTFYPVSRDYGFLGQLFNEADGGLGGTPINNFVDLYWKNEDLASTIVPYLDDDADADGVINSLDADAFDDTVQ